MTANERQELITEVEHELKVKSYLLSRLASKPMPDIHALYFYTMRVQHLNKELECLVFPELYVKEIE